MKKYLIILLISALFFETSVAAFPSYQIEDTVTPILYERDEYNLTMSGWDVDRRGGEITSYRLSHYEINDKSTKFPIIMKHKLDNIANFIYESSFSFSDLTDGFYINFYTSSGEKLISVTADHKGWYAGANKVSDFQYDTKYMIKIKAQDGRYTVFINGKNSGSFDCLTGTAAALLEIGTSNEYKCKFDMGYTLLCADYAVNDRFFTLYDEWQLLSGTAQISASYDSGTDDAAALELSDATVKQEFNVISGKTAAELKCRMDNCSSFLMQLGSNTSVTAENGQIFCAGKAVKTYSDNVWQTIRIESDSETADFYINGKHIANLNITDTADSLTLTASGTVYVDDVTVCGKNIPSDYPLLSRSEAIGLNDSTYIAMQACYLMRNGTSRGWDTFTPYDDVKPYLGYYDDGNPEAMDWELKWMAQHGIDYVLPCFYQPANYKGGIVRPTNTVFENGYFMAQNSKYVKFAFNLCNSFAKNAKPSSRELTNEEINENIQNFKEYVIPYLCERFFCDDRYMKIDNKPLLYIWSPIDFKNHYGVSGTMEILTSLDSECKKYGYNGIYAFAGADFAHNEGDIQEYAEMGFDYTFNYTTGSSQGDSAGVQKDVLNGRKNMPLDAIANVSNGQNQRAWYKYAKNHAWMNEGDYKNLLSWTLSEYMASYSTSSLASKMITIDNWNELGEGHFVQPTEYCGFGYLDAIRSVFTAGGVHTDTVPNEEQKQRISGLFPENRKILRYIRPYTGTNITKNVQMEWDFTGGNVPVTFKSISVSDLKYTSSGLSATASGSDPILMSEVDLQAKDIEYIHVRMKIDPTDSSQNEYISQVFFATEEYPEIKQERAVGEYGLSGKTVDVYYDMRENKYWNGRVTSLRFDPMEKKGSFNIEKIEFLGEDAYTAVINGESYLMPCAPQFSGQMLLPVESVGGICTKLNFYVEYDENTLTIKGEDTLVMTIGDTKALLNGQEITLGAAPVIFRGAAMVPKDAFELLGVSVSVNDKEIMLTQDIEIPDIKQYPPYEWYFDYDEQGWNVNSAVSLSDITDGIWRQRAKALSSNSESADPSMSIDLTETPIVGARYPSVEIRMKNIDAGGVMQLFFMGDEIGTEPSEANSVKADIKSSTEGFCIYTLDMSGVSAWKDGIINNLRFDPVSKPGSYEIDYIKLCKQPEVVYGSVNKKYGKASAVFTNTDSETEPVCARFIAAFYENDGSLNSVVWSDEKTVNPWESVTLDLSGMRTQLYVKNYGYKMFVWKNGMTPCKVSIITKE